MKLIILLALPVLLISFLKLRASPTLPADTARQYLQQGALLVDVRTPAEYASGHLTNAVNIPLDEIKSSLPSRVPDKGQVILLYCRSGRRSRLAEQQLGEMGYTNVFNLGSYTEAEKLLRDANSKPGRS